jgi:broad-specificity NMP kinase
MLIVFSGAPGTGKTTLSRLLAQQRGAVYLRIDTMDEPIMETYGDDIADVSARRSLALRPAHSRCHQFVTRFPKATATSSPP